MTVTDSFDGTGLRNVGIINNYNTITVAASFGNTGLRNVGIINNYNTITVAASFGVGLDNSQIINNYNTITVTKATTGSTSLMNVFNIINNYGTVKFVGSDVNSDDLAGIINTCGKIIGSSGATLKDCTSNIATDLAMTANPLELSLSSPYKQAKSGVHPDDVTCKERHTKMTKSSDGRPICVTSSTALKLAEREHATISKS